ncbi:hypothetical protein [Micrococcus luteus]|nr:hypothetical protein [Micrococcus luteus]
MRSTPRALLLLANRRGPYRIPDVVATISWSAVASFLDAVLPR